jgi:hypothetical protein
MIEAHVDIPQVDGGTATRRRTLSTGAASRSVLLNHVLRASIATTYLRLLQGRTPVGVSQKGRGGRKGGSAKRGWTIRSQDGTQAEFENAVASPQGYHYPVILERGSRVGQKPWPRPGPRTTLAPASGGDLGPGEPRIFSRQAPGGIAIPAFAQLEVGEVADAAIEQILDILGID